MQQSAITVKHYTLKVEDNKANRNETKLYIIDNKTLNLKLTCE